jgi:bifunctional non-homologous end joining protein LigD
MDAAVSPISNSPSKRTAACVTPAQSGRAFSDTTMRMLRKVLDPLTQTRSTVPSFKVKGAVWVRPELHAMVAYRGFTIGGELRHASFKGLRDDE